MNPVWFTGSIFLLTFALIVTERVHRMVAALIGAVVLILVGIISQEKAFHAIDWNVIFLLVSMMVIANVLRDTGIFQWIAVKAVQLGKGKPFRILAFLALVTAVLSALLDNVTIVVLIAPVSLFVASTLRISPIPFLITGILASNIGGTATLVGDPPNILIGSAAGIDFLTFSYNLAPISIIILGAFIGILRLLFKNEMQTGILDPIDIQALDTSELITNKPLLWKALVVMTLVIAGFLIHGFLHLEPATVALTGATVLMLWSRNDPHPILRDVEWTTLFFFIGLFITVAAIEEVGIIEVVAQSVLNLTGGNIQLTSMLLLWFSALASGIVDNIPYTAAMIPLIENMGQFMPIAPLWWSLALGACLGGNATLVGAAANVVVASLADSSGHPISFIQFLKYGLVVTFLSLVFASFYIWIRYL